MIWQKGITLQIEFSCESKLISKLIKPFISTKMFGTIAQFSNNISTRYYQCNGIFFLHSYFGGIFATLCVHKCVLLDLFRSKFLKPWFNAHAGGGSLWRPMAVKSVLCDYVSLNRLRIFFVVIINFIFTPFITIKIFEKQFLPWKKMFLNTEFQFFTNWWGYSKFKQIIMLSINLNDRKISEK